MTDHANMLRQAAAEMRHYGHDGWPNVCDWGADELDRLNAQALELCAEISGLRRENESMRHDLGVLRGHHHEGCMAEIERLRGLLRECLPSLKRDGRPHVVTMVQAALGDIVAVSAPDRESVTL